MLALMKEGDRMKKTVFPSTKTEILSVPWDASKIPVKTYTPIDCDFTDELEFLAVKKILVEIEHWNKEGLTTKTSGLIRDIETANHEEHLIVTNGSRIRLDFIIQLKILN
jgi:transcriptional antiterminator Rof (Rho-off)